MLYATALHDFKPSDYYASLPSHNTNMNSELTHNYVLYTWNVKANEKINLILKRFSSYRAVNTLLGYKNQGNTEQGNKSCLFRDPHKTKRRRELRSSGL